MTYFSLIGFAHDKPASEIIKIGKQWVEKNVKELCTLKKQINDVDFLDSKLKKYSEFYKIIDNTIFMTSKKKKEKTMTKIFNDEKNAKLRLFNFTYYDVIICEFKKMLSEHNFDMLIGGSSVLSAVMMEPGKQFKPNDMDIYIKNITNEKIVVVDKYIQKLFDQDNGFNVYVVRRSITMTWWVFKDGIFCVEIQLNLYDINSWSEIFALYHADMVCIGYDIKCDEIITHDSRWLTFAESYSHNSLIFMTDEFGLRNKKHISNIVAKYSSRNFNIVGISNSVKDDDRSDMSGSSSALSNDDILTKKPIDILILKYSAHDDIFIDSDIKNLLTEIKPPKLLHMFEPTNSQFMNSVFDIDLCDDNNVECPVYLCNVNLIMQNTECEHYVSMNAYIKQKTTKCPLCRTSWEEKNTYISCAKTYKLQMIDKKKNINNKYAQNNEVEEKIVIDDEVTHNNTLNDIVQLDDILEIPFNDIAHDIIDRRDWDEEPVAIWSKSLDASTLDFIHWTTEEINEPLSDHSSLNSNDSDDEPNVRIRGDSADDSDDEPNVRIRYDDLCNESDSD